MMLFGRTDVVPNLFYVGTLFYHVAYVPLIPRKSYLVVHEEEEEPSATEHNDDGRPCCEIRRSTFIEIPLSKKSVILAWFRCFPFWAWIMHMVIMTNALSSPYYYGLDGFQQAPSVIFFVTSTAMVCLSWIATLPCFCKASYERVPHLVRYLSHNNSNNTSTTTPALARQIQRRIDRHFGRAMTDHDGDDDDDDNNNDFSGDEDVDAGGGAQTTSLSQPLLPSDVIIDDRSVPTPSPPGRVGCVPTAINVAILLFVAVSMIITFFCVWMVCNTDFPTMQERFFVAIITLYVIPILIVIMLQP